MNLEIFTFLGSLLTNKTSCFLELLGIERSTIRPHKQKTGHLRFMTFCKNYNIFPNSICVEATKIFPFFSF